MTKELQLEQSPRKPKALTANEVVYAAEEMSALRQEIIYIHETTNRNENICLFTLAGAVTFVLSEPKLSEIARLSISAMPTILAIFVYWRFKQMSDNINYLDEYMADLESRIYISNKKGWVNHYFHNVKFKNKSFMSTRIYFYVFFVVTNLISIYLIENYLY